MSQKVRHFICDRTASTAAEFALVLPLLLIFLFGLIDAGRFMWTCNRAEKATQMGARFAVATNILPAGLVNYSFAVSGGIPQGDPIPQSSFGGASCNSSTNATQATAVTCSCTGTCPSLGTADPVDFNRILTRMQLFMPELKANQIKVDYGYSGLGYAGDPNGLDVSPLVTVSLRQDSNRPLFYPITLLVFGASIPLPAFAASLTMEDGSGTAAN